MPLKETCEPNTVAGGPYDCWNPPRPVCTEDQCHSCTAPVGSFLNVPPLAPALPRLRSKFPPLAPGTGREDMMDQTMLSV